MTNNTYLRGHRAKLMVAEDWKVIPDEVLNEIIKSFDKEEFDKIIDRLIEIPN